VATTRQGRLNYVDFQDHFQPRTYYASIFEYGLQIKCFKFV